MTDLEALWEKGSDWIVGRWQYSDENQKALLKRRAEDAVIRSEVHRLNKDAVYEPLSCVPLSKSACALLDYLEAAVAPDVAAARDVLPTPKPLPPSAPPAPTQAPAASEAPFSDAAPNGCTAAPTANVTASLGGGAVVVAPAARISGATFELRVERLLRGGVRADALVPLTREMRAQAAALLQRLYPPAAEAPKAAGKTAADRAPEWPMVNALARPPGATLAFLLVQHPDDRLPREWAAWLLAAALAQAAEGGDAAAAAAALAEALRRALQAPQAPRDDGSRELVLGRAPGLCGGAPSPKRRRHGQAAGGQGGRGGGGPSSADGGESSTDEEERIRRSATPAPNEARGAGAEAAAVPDGEGGGGNGGGGGWPDRSQPMEVQAPAVSAGPIIVETPVAELAGQPSDVELWATRSEAAFRQNKSLRTSSVRESGGYAAIDFGWHATRGEPLFVNRRRTALRSILRLPPITTQTHCVPRCRSQRRSQRHRLLHRQRQGVPAAAHRL